MKRGEHAAARLRPRPRRTRPQLLADGDPPPAVALLSTGAAYLTRRTLARRDRPDFPERPASMRLPCVKSSIVSEPAALDAEPQLSASRASTRWRALRGTSRGSSSFGSFVTVAGEPNDVDVFLLMENTFDASRLTGEARLLFDHGAAQAHFGSSVFWLRRLAAWEGRTQR